MLNCLIGEVHIQLDESEGWSGADCVSPDLKVLLKARDLFLTPVRSLLDHSLRVSVVSLDEPFLRVRTGRLDCELPKP